MGDYPASSAGISGKSDLYMQENEIFPVLTARFSIYVMVKIRREVVFELPKIAFLWIIRQRCV